jgi:hypothetical protein
MLRAADFVKHKVCATPLQRGPYFCFPFVASRIGLDRGKTRPYNLDCSPAGWLAIDRLGN